MQRRTFLECLVLGVIGCNADGGPDSSGDPDAAAGSGAPMPDGAAVMTDACVAPTVLMHDTDAQALYLDGTLGPLTGTIRVAYVTAGAAITLDFWHGHAGVQHRFTLTPQMFEMLKQGQKITVATTTVDGHAHTLFIDPKDEHYRVAGAPDVPVSLGC